MPPLRAWSLLPVALAACAAETPRSPSPASSPARSLVAAPSASAPPTAPSEAPVAAPLPPDITDAKVIVPPTNAVCTVPGSGGTFVVRLRPARGEPVVAVLKSGDVKIALLQSGGAYAEGHTGSVRAHGYVDLDDFFFEPSRPLTFGIVTVTPKASVRVAWTDGGMQAIATSQFVQWEGPPPTTSVTCADLSFGADPQPFPSGSTVSPGSTGDPKGGDLVLWHGSAPIAAEPSGKPVGSLESEGGTLHVLERRGARTRVRVESAAETVVGWVPANQVMTAAQAKKKQEEEEKKAEKVNLQFMGGLYDGPVGPLNGVLAGTSPGHPVSPESLPEAEAGAKPSGGRTVEGLVCAGSLRLMTKLDGRHIWIGTLDPGASVIVVSRDGAVAQVRLAHSVAGGFRPPRGLEVPARDIASCTAGMVKDD